jgi:pyruvate dehydrogenase E2 component (dihydrolipoamide acetyltransferase)
MKNGNLVSWVKQEGDMIEPGDVLVEIETDKAIMEVEATTGGVLSKIIVAAGTASVAIDTPIAIISQVGDTDELIQTAISEAMRPQTGQQREMASETGPLSSQTVLVDNNQLRNVVKSSPLARKIAEINGIDLCQLTGTGPGGRIIRCDVENKLRVESDSPLKNSVKYVDEEASPLRKVIADKLTKIKQEVPHFYMKFVVDVTDLLKIREDINDKGHLGTKITINDMIIKATALAMRDEPSVNAAWNNGKIRKFRTVDIAVAVAVPDGLYTPVIENADRKSLADISVEIKNLTELAKQGRLHPSQYNGGSLTISNLGMYEVDTFLSIINSPQGGILSIGAAKPTPMFDCAGTLTKRYVVNIGYAIDHRIIDGKAAALFLNALSRYMSSPALLIIS